MSAQLREMDRVAYYAAEFAAQVVRARECLRAARWESSAWLADAQRREARACGRNARGWWQLLKREVAR